MAEAIHLDNPLASDLSCPSKMVSVFRIRGDKYHAIVDFGYVPPIVQGEEAELQANPVNVHTRLAIPYELVEQLVKTLSGTMDAAKKNLEAEANNIQIGPQRTPRNR